MASCKSPMTLIKLKGKGGGGGGKSTLKKEYSIITFLADLRWREREPALIGPQLFSGLHSSLLTRHSTLDSNDTAHKAPQTCL